MNGLVKTPIYLDEIFDFESPLTLPLIKTELVSLKQMPEYKFLLEPTELSYHSRQLIHCFDISEHESIRLSYATDPVTNLEYHTSWIKNTKLPNNKEIVIQIKLSNLREINIQNGMKIGNQVLKEAVRKLRATLPSENAVYRFQGAKFLVRIPNIANCDFCFSNWFYKMLPSSLVIHHKNQSLEIKLYWGVGYVHSNGIDSTKLLVEKSSIALSQLSKRGSNIKEYTPDDIIRINKTRELRDTTKHYLDRRMIELWLQPQVNQFRQIVAYEALARIKADNGDVLQPNQFIPQIQKYEWDVEFSSQVLEQATEIIKQWPKNLPKYPISINLTGLEIMDDIFFEKLLRLYSENKDLRELLELEITETSKASSDTLTLARLSCLSELGVKILVDDFGTGHSSLSQLIELSAYAIKIDRCF
ncbi:EAL domain-containing protein, partial [Catenovulum sp. 2E275]|uniref:GGDEF domain-containing phosphodiesterase n=1 Tax=Catenovulum sp. 2E275 TaxID=2980497 RepID=UPI0021CF5450